MAKSTVAVRFTGSVADLQKSIGQANGSLASIGKVGALAGAAVAAGVVAAGVGLVKLGSTFDEQYDKIRIGTGATGEALGDLESSFKNVLKGVPASFDDAGTAIADLNTALGLTGKDLEIRSKQFLELSRITGTDVGTNIESLTRVFGDWGVSTDGQTDAMNQLFVASQATGIGVSDLASGMTTAGVPLRAFGLSFTESAALLGKWQKEGVNTDAIMSGLKAGLGKMAKAGKDPVAEFGRLKDAMKNAATEGEAIGIAVEAFGSRAGGDMALAVREGRFEIDDLAQSIALSQETIMQAGEDTQSFGEKWTMIKNRVLVGLEPLARKAFDGMGVAMDALGPMIDSLAKWFSEVLVPAFAQVQAWVAEHWPQIQATITTAVETVRSVIEGVLTVITTLWDNFGNNILEFVERVWPAIQQTIEGALAIIRGVIQTVTSLIKGDWSGVWDGIKAIVGGVWEAIQGIVKTALEGIRLIMGAVLEVIGSAFKGAWDGLAGMVDTAWDAIYEFVTGGFDKVLELITGMPERIATAAKGLFDALKEAATDAAKWVLAKIDSMLGPLDEIVGKLAKIGGGIAGGISGAVGKLPFFDHGGVMPGPIGKHSLALVAGGETIVPTHKPGVSVPRSGPAVHVENLHVVDTVDLDLLLQRAAVQGAFG